jgi:NAD(P)H-dependent FMN reductase
VVSRSPFACIEMTRDTQAVAVCGSLAADSVTRVALREALRAARSAGAQTTFVDLREYDLPTFDADNQDAGDAPELRTELRNADAIVLGTPMYHGSFSSTLKTAVDYSGFDEFEDTTVGLLAVSGGSFPRTALEHLRSVVRALDAWPLPLDVAVPDSHEQVVDGTLVDESLQERVNRLGSELVKYAGVAQYPATTHTTQAQPHAD